MNTIKLLDELEAKAEEQGGSYCSRCGPTPSRAEAALDEIAFKHLRPLVEALNRLDKRHGWGPGMGPCICIEHELARQALAALDTDLEAALKEVRDEA